MRGASIFRRDGQAVVELTFGFLIFFSLFMAIVEFSHLLYSKVTLSPLRTAGDRWSPARREPTAAAFPIPRDQMIHDVFCNNIIAAGVQCPSIGDEYFQFACLGGICTQPAAGQTKPSWLRSIWLTFFDAVFLALFSVRWRAVSTEHYLEERAAF